MAKKTVDPDEIVHLQVATGETVVYRDHAYGDRATLQVRRGDLGEVEGKYDEVDPGAVPDAGERPAGA
ncbi:MAG: hypothetical protein ACR2NH_12850 [Solirubrobacteraceae bacterium]